MTNDQMVYKCLLLTPLAKHTSQPSGRTLVYAYHAFVFAYHAFIIMTPTVNSHIWNLLGDF